MVFPAGYLGLQALFADSSAVGARALAPLEIEAHYAQLGARYGANLVPPEPLMRRVVEDFLMEGRGARAGVWLERTVAAYGQSPDHAALAARVEQVTALGEPPETVAELLALPRATPAEMQGWLGSWKGTVWHGPGSGDDLTVRFWVVGDSVEGQVEHEQGPPQPIEYLRFGPGGALVFGYKNGMRPRGLILYQDASPGGSLEGEVVFGGMRFVPPPGATFPTVRFRLEHVDDDPRPPR